MIKVTIASEHDRIWNESWNIDNPNTFGNIIFILSRIRIGHQNIRTPGTKYISRPQNSLFSREMNDRRRWTWRVSELCQQGGMTGKTTHFFWRSFELCLRRELRNKHAIAAFKICVSKQSFGIPHTFVRAGKTFQGYWWKRSEWQVTQNLPLKYIFLHSWCQTLWRDLKLEVEWKNSEVDFFQTVRFNSLSQQLL